MILKLFFIALVLLVIMSIISAFAANISVPSTRLTDQRSAITANTLKPTACSGITLTTIVYCPSTGGMCSGTTASELIIGSSNADSIDGKGGSDCIIGGDGADDIAGSQANDVCIGGPGIDTFKKCETVIQ
jgi:Ca2+-binding RTX toxin-like protein